MTCPKCSSPHVKDVHYDFGKDPQTGYLDAGELFQCMECGEVLSEEEVLQMLASVMIAEAEIELGPDRLHWQALALAGCSLREAAARMAVEKGLVN